MASRQRVLSGIQITSDSFQLGNYLGALRQWVRMQDENDAFYCVVDLHSLTADPPAPDDLRSRSRFGFAQMLAAGLDPERCTVFAQSQVPGHTQLSWILECLTGYGEATRMTQFKDKSQRAERVSVGLLTYPVLMAADILLYQADAVPVGEDQRQHLELTRNLAERFNARYGPTFVVPEPYIVRETAKILDLQTPAAKMSKSLPDAGTVYLLDDLAVITRKFKRAVTDSDNDIRYDPTNKPGVSNLLTVLAAFTDRTIEATVDDLAGQGYGALKTQTAEAVVAFAEPFAKRVHELMSDPAELDRIIAAGSAKADEVARQTVHEVYDKVGFLPPARR